LSAELLENAPNAVETQVERKRVAAPGGDEVNLENYR
jgi:hypothetical protein